MDTEQLISGMTVNERLAHLGLFDAFDSAVATRNLDSVIALLRQAHLNEAQATQTAQAILANPSHYGFN